MGVQTSPLSPYSLAPSGSLEQYSGNRQTPLLTQVSDPLGDTVDCSSSPLQFKASLKPTENLKKRDVRRTMTPDRSTRSHNVKLKCPRELLQSDAPCRVSALNPLAMIPPEIETSRLLLL